MAVYSTRYTRTPLPAFSDIPLHAQLQKALAALDFTEPTPVQAKAIPAILDGNDVMVSSQTGSGKTAAFIVPLLNKLLSLGQTNTATLGLILLPTRELALQTQTVFKQLATYTPIKSGVIIGGEAYKHQVATLRKNPEVLIATPGRLVEHIEKGNTDFSDLAMLVLDEADRMLDMGFAEDMHTIASACRNERQNLLFSATLKHRGLEKITPILKAPVRLTIDQRGEAHSQITQYRVLADDDKHKEQLTAALITEFQAKKVMVFCNTRKQCQELSNTLRYKTFKSDFIHGEMSQSDRKQVLNRFRDGKLRILVATDLTARGLDIKDIDLVINFSMAHSGDDHIHRVGRTGRAEQSGTAITLISANEWNLMSSVERYLNFRFEARSVQGLKANYKGPKKLKNSGKVVGKKKKKGSKKH